tara:strand:+ start:168 stop:290 length:123 start_codon:yes stop_codon:yes gene_type:complete
MQYNVWQMVVIKQFAPDRPLHYEAVIAIARAGGVFMLGPV